jgi:hypothetical protein
LRSHSLTSRLTLVGPSGNYPYRDAAAAVEVDGPYDQAFEEARKLVRPDKQKFEAEQARRFALLEAHWDVIVTAFDPKK